MNMITAIHGINTGLTDKSWNLQLQAYAVNQGWPATVQTEHYKAGPWPWWNTHVKNPRLAKAVFNRLMMLEERHSIHIVAHSNGGDIALKAVKLLAKAGRRVDSLVLIGAAVESDIGKSGLLDLVTDDLLGKVVSYCSHLDTVVNKLELIKGNYGALGGKGFRLNLGFVGMILTGHEEDPGTKNFITRWFDEFGHSGYFAPPTIRLTFETIKKDFGIK